jgi:hypothetical protein
MPCCNGADRGCAARQHHPTRKRADFPLVWRHERTWQTDFKERRRYVGSGNASWCGSQPGDRFVCSMCVSWRSLPASGGGPSLYDSDAPWYNSSARGVSNSPHGRPGVTAYQRENGSDCLPRGDDGFYPSPSAAAA